MEFLVSNNELENWMLALGACIGATATMAFARSIALRRLAERPGHTPTRVDDLIVLMLRKTYLAGLLAIGIYLGSIFLLIPESWTLVVSRLAIAALILQLALWGDTGLRGWRSQLLNTPGDGNRKASSTIVFFMLRLVVWMVGFLMMLDNFGFNITTLVASLGVGGIAVALATQSILGDLFASLSIMLDKPFEVGDFIIVGDALGAVEYIGLKTTRLRGLGGEQIVFSNGELLRSRIHNHKRMLARRVAFVLRVAYGTGEARLTAIPGIVRDIIAARTDVDFERAHFFRYGDWSLDFEVVYHFKNPDYLLHMDAQHAILLQVYRAFQQEEIQFAHPLSVVRVADTGDPAGGWPPPSAPLAAMGAKPTRH
ncbi:mechanosensitive ion channel family protein [Massilia sp. H6]|uniref:mechanosensitive ion channel family protein n=1 Tax=Massilia sp. H6 TaxID=2970464 RepID=UPI0021691B1B|nr:mechanosensitive ion channel family protein [Massilia sp. H6]UVW27148.1 mechanosensitive ion channel family protein [Massilia sp. H6]